MPRRVKNSPGESKAGLSYREVKREVEGGAEIRVDGRYPDKTLCPPLSLFLSLISVVLFFNKQRERSPLKSQCSVTNIYCRNSGAMTRNRWMQSSSLFSSLPPPLLLPSSRDLASGLSSACEMTKRSVINSLYVHNETIVSLLAEVTSN